MLILEGVFENGQVIFPTQNLPQKKMKVQVTFIEEEEDRNQQKSITVKEFTQKWTGVIEGAEIENWKEDRIQYLKEKHQ